jgi:hypothetical protein
MAEADQQPLITAISLVNFRGFRNQQDIPLAPLTFLVGPNSAGKSSISDGILFLAQSEALGDTEDTRLNWAGPLVDLGSFEDAVYRHNTHQRMKIALAFANVGPFFSRYGTSRPLPNFKVEYEFKSGRRRLASSLAAASVTELRTGARLSLELGPTTHDALTLSVPKRRAASVEVPRARGTRLHKTITRFLSRGRFNSAAQYDRWRALSPVLLSGYLFHELLENTQRVSSARAGPRRWYALAEQRPARRRVFDSVDPESPSNRVARRGDAIRREQLNEVLKKLDIASSINDYEQGPYHSGIHVKDNRTGVTSNLVDVGFGASQAIPVIRALLWNRYPPAAGPLIIEQPEIHLHPKAQGVIAELLCEASLRRQVIVETHSEHMINRARIMLAQQRLPENHVVINFVSRDKKGSHVLTIPVKSDGSFGTDWPEGFFDERYQDSLRLMSLKSSTRGE